MTTAIQKGFGIKIKPINQQSFYCECLWHDIQTDEEQFIEQWHIQIDTNKFNNSHNRKLLAMALVYSFLGTPEATERKINRVFIWNNKTGCGEPLVVISDNQLEGSEFLTSDVDPIKAYERLSAICSVTIKTIAPPNDEAIENRNANC
jgi:hypothetical protein